MRHLPEFDMSDMTKIGAVAPHSIHLAITEHGALRVLLVAAKALMRAVVAPAQPDLTERLSEHLRRDIGLPPRGSPARQAPMLPVRW